MDEQDKELSVIYKIFNEIYSKAPPMLKDLSDESVDIDYKESIEDPMDFKTIAKQFQDKKYYSLTDVVKDIRLTFLNCYKYYGVKSDYTLKSLELEELLEQNISCLDEHYKLFADIKLTFKILNIEGKSNFEFKYPKDCYDSILLRSVAHCRPKRLSEYHKILSATLTTDENDTHILEEILTWENEIYFNDHYKYISSMSELPEIGFFMAIVFKQLNIDIVSQGEIERMFLMPKESTAMSKIMTILLEPNKKKSKNIDCLMPYSVWSKKFDKKVSEWYKIYHSKNQNKVDAMNVLGIDSDFWDVFDDKNPLDKCEFVELTYFKKVWLVKGLCDYVFTNYKTIYDIMRNYCERQSTIWKNDMETEEYFYLSLMPDLRIYYRSITYNQPSVEFHDCEKIKNDTKKEDTLDSDITDVSNADPRIKLNENKFKLIAESVQGLRSFLNELNTNDSSVPDDLINSLENFLMKIEPEEYNLIILNNSSKIKLFKDWKSYSKNIKDKTLQWREEKIEPSMPPDISKEFIMEKCKRSAAINHKLYIDDSVIYDDEYFNDIDSAYTDSGDEWEPMNQQSNKIKETIQKSKVDDDDNSDSCEIVPENDSETIKSNSSVETTIDANNPISDKDVGPNKNLEVIEIDDEQIVISDDDDEQIVISDDDDDIQFISITQKKVQPLKINKPNSLGNNSVHRSPSLVSKNRQITSTNVRNARLQEVPRKRAAANLPNVSTMPPNLNLPTGIQISMVNKPQTSIPSYFNATKRPKFRSNNHQTNNTQTVNIKCRVISKPNFNGEVKFCVELPNGKQHPVADDLMNDYLKQHNHVLPEYWLVPLSIDVAKQYGFQ